MLCLEVSLRRRILFSSLAEKSSVSPEAQRRSECNSNYDLVCAGIALSSYTILANKDVQELFENKVSKMFYDLRTWMMNQKTMDVSEAITLCFSEVSLYLVS